MEANFKKLQQDHQNTVDNLIKWMKDCGRLLCTGCRLDGYHRGAYFCRQAVLCKIVDGKNVTEDKARKLFDDVADVKNVEFSKFQAAVTKLAADQQKNVDAFMKTLADEGPKFLEAAAAAASAFKDAFTKK